MIARTFVRTVVLAWALGSTLGACGSGEAASEDSFIPSFDRQWTDETGDQFFFLVDDRNRNAPSGPLTGNHNVGGDNGVQVPFTGMYSHRDLSFTEQGGLSYQGHFSDKDTIAINRSDGAKRTLHGTPQI